MKASQKARVVILGGITIFCLALFGIYKVFFTPRIGPIGTGEYHWTTYVIFTSMILSSICFSLLGITMYLKNKQVKS